MPNRSAMEIQISSRK